MANGMFTPQGYMTPEQILQMTGFAQGAFAPQQKQGLTLGELQQQLETAGTRQGPTGLGAFAYSSPEGEKSRQIGSQQLETGMEKSGGVGAGIRNLRTRRTLAELAAEGVDMSTSEGAKKAGDVLMERGLADQAQAQYARAAEIQKANLPAATKYNVQELPMVGPQGAAWTKKVLMDDQGNVIRELGAGPKGSGVNIFASEKEESKAKIRIAEKDYNEAREKGTLAASELTSIQTAKSILADPAFETGALEPLKTTIAAYAEGAGISPDVIGLNKASTAEQYRAVMNNLALEKVKALRPATDRDVIFVQKTIGDLGNTKAANEFANRALESAARQDVMKASFYNDRYMDSDLTEIAYKWKKSPYNVPLVGVAKSGKNPQPVFWHEYYDAISNMRKPDGTPIPIEEIRQRWLRDYGR